MTGRSTPLALGVNADLLTAPGTLATSTPPPGLPRPGVLARSSPSRPFGVPVRNAAAHGGTDSLAAADAHTAATGPPVSLRACFELDLDEREELTFAHLRLVAQALGKSERTVWRWPAAAREDRRSAGWGPRTSPSPRK
ncbi:hypothetical protein [Streptomyces sp. NPDC127112]|uniref:hypothetical protein n=1 Tax=Streptomyces sp. NPDC127112 TaxID=3345364 RepID=UPI00362C99B5